MANAALRGPDHQVTRAAIAPPQTAAASSTQPTFTASQRVRVMLCAQAKSLVRASNSCATSGAPTSTPNRTGASMLRMAKSCPSTLPSEEPPSWRLAQVRLAVHPASRVCHCAAIWNPVTSSTVANTASTSAATAACTRYCRQVSQVIALLQPR